MKKFLFALLLIIFMIPDVKAETLTHPDYYFNDLSDKYVINSFDFLYSKFSEEVINMYDLAINEYNSKYKENYPFYLISYSAIFNDSSFTDINTFELTLYFNSSAPSCASDNLFRCDFEGRIIVTRSEIWSSGVQDNIYTGAPGIISNDSYDMHYFSTTDYFTSNFDVIVPSTANTPYSFTINNQTYSLEAGDVVPKFYTSPYPEDIYTTVNLDDYEYVILNLKDYSSTEAFEVNLLVKGSIAITPVYEFGTVEKENITDLCNTSYSDYTDYRFFILKNDLINNAVYIVKECSDSGSSFKFDSTIFDITYVTAENVDDPVITFGGIDYHTIPFDSLTNTVNKNEEEGYIPGASEQFDPFSSIVDYISSFWSSLSTFMSLVTKFFNTLPIEIRAIAITTFGTACTLGLLKILKA